MRKTMFAVVIIIGATVLASQAGRDPSSDTAAIEKAVLAVHAEKFFSYIPDFDKGLIIQDGTVFKTRQEALDTVKAGYLRREAHVRPDVCDSDLTGSRPAHRPGHVFRHALGWPNSQRPIRRILALCPARRPVETPTRTLFPAESPIGEYHHGKKSGKIRGVTVTITKSTERVPCRRR